MMVSFVSLLVTALSLLVVDLIVPGVNIATFPAALIAAFAIGVVNSIAKPALSAASLPLNYATLGAFSLVVNGLTFWLASIFVPGFGVHGILAVILGPVVLSFVNTFVTKYLVERRPGLMAGTNPELPKIDAQS